MRVLKTFSLFAFVLLVSSFTTNISELKWLGWNEGYDMAKKKNKIAVVDIYTDWCGWCKVMDRETFTKTEVIDLINKEFVPVKFNPEVQGATYTFNGKQYSGQELAAIISNNQLSGFPSTVFYFPKTNEFKMEVGYKNPQAFTEILNNMVKYKAETAAKKGKKS